MSRIKYYSSSDLSTGHNLIKCEEILNQFDEEKEYNDVNDVLELYNITLFFDNELKLLKWSDVEYENYKKISGKMKGKVYKFFSSIRNDNFKVMYDEVLFEYKDDFWLLFNDNIGRLNIDSKTFDDVLNSNHINIYDILCNKGIMIVKYFLKL